MCLECKNATLRRLCRKDAQSPKRLSEDASADFIVVQQRILEDHHHAVNHDEGPQLETTKKRPSKGGGAQRAFMSKYLREH